MRLEVALAFYSSRPVEASVAVRLGNELPPNKHAEDDVADATAEFLAMLVELGGHLGNQALRQALGWTDAEYDDIKQHLVETRKIAIGRGRGGSVTMLD